MIKMMKVFSIGALFTVALQAHAGLVDLGNGMVYDDVTQLTWTKSPRLAGDTWQSAKTYADGFDLNGLTNWRLPKLTSPADGCVPNCNSLTSELSDMYSRNLGFTVDVKPNPLSSAIFGSFDVTNADSGGHDIFWLGDEFATGSHYTFVFSYENSGLNIYGRNNAGGDIGQWGAWLVTDEYRPNPPGVPIPGTLLLAGLGLLALRATTRGSKTSS